MTDATTTPPVAGPPVDYVMDGKGRYVPRSMVKPHEALEDQTVREILRHAKDLNAQIARFKGHTNDDVATFLDILAEKYGAKKGGAKGNMTLTSYDNCLKVVVQVADFLTFGPELQVAKALFDECISEWSEGANDKVRALVDHAFQVDKQGQINRASVFGLRRLDIDDDNWRRAIDALNDSIRIMGSKQYIRFYKRPHPGANWQAITIDLASAEIPTPVSTDEEAA
ncbi:MAG: sulfate transporter [Pusillimonas sp.]|nr:sulfate transporter [Pusillimonas sp.]|tara:strand:- start:34768 stop:35445 length:678 start_codon:yes stop_codon:yes gene_type:complete